MDKKGPSTEPCRTPLINGKNTKRSFSTVTHCMCMREVVLEPVMNYNQNQHHLTSVWPKHGQQYQNLLLDPQRGQHSTSLYQQQTHTHTHTLKQILLRIMCFWYGLCCLLSNWHLQTSNKIYFLINNLVTLYSRWT